MTGIVVEIARARGGDVLVDRIALADGARLADALDAALRAGLVSAAELAVLTAGVYGRMLPPDHPLADGDRVELTAALQADPKLARQNRVARRRAGQPRDKWNPVR